MRVPATALKTIQANKQTTKHEFDDGVEKFRFNELRWRFIRSYNAVAR